MSFKIKATRCFAFGSLYILSKERYDLVNVEQILSLDSTMGSGFRPMIKKLFSKALLLIIMDKRARNKFKIMRGRKRHLNNIGQSINQFFTKQKNGDMAKKNKSQTTIGHDGAYGKLPPPVPPQQSSDNPNPAETELLIQKATETVKQKLIKDRKKPINKKRQDLIEEAMAMRKEKSHILERLDREKLKQLSNMVKREFDQSAVE